MELYASKDNNIYRVTAIMSNNNNKGLKPVSSSMDDVRDVPRMVERQFPILKMLLETVLI